MLERWRPRFPRKKTYRSAAAAEVAKKAKSVASLSLVPIDVVFHGLNPSRAMPV
ncbi:MAG: hypothetical protein JSV90_03445 [Methanobacteriota archaeon]|nr:MAG: hypothetical protein JSV90_03445 [Euryarchaeota archaeon]